MLCISRQMRNGRMKVGHSGVFLFRALRRISDRTEKTCWMGNKMGHYEFFISSLWVFTVLPYIYSVLNSGCPGQICQAMQKDFSLLIPFYIISFQNF